MSVIEILNHIYKTMLSHCLRCRKNMESKNPNKDTKYKLRKTNIFMFIFLFLQYVIVKN